MSASYKRISFQFNEETDADVIEYLDRQPNKTEAVKKALRTQIEQEATA